MALKAGPAGKGPSGIPDAGQYAAVGVQFTAGILVFAFLGNWLDGRLGTKPWLLLLGVFGGFALSVFWIVRRLGAATREARKP
jgi:F0F1-type ATP synthase assembly protein I